MASEIGDSNPYAPPGSAQFAGDARVRVRRTKAYADSLRAYRVMIDKVEVARVSNGKIVEFMLESGTHTIDVRIDWCSSPRINFSIAPGETAEFECSSNLQGLRILLAAVYALFLRDEYLMLNQVS